MDELEADFIAFYGVRDFEELDGPKFLRLAQKLIYREGVLKLKVQIDLEEIENGGTGSSSKPVKTVKMSEAAKQYTGADDLSLIDADGAQAGFGPLFERTSVQTN